MQPMAVCVKQLVKEGLFTLHVLVWFFWAPVQAFNHSRTMATERWRVLAHFHINFGVVKARIQGQT